MIDYRQVRAVVFGLALAGAGCGGDIPTEPAGEPVAVSLSIIPDVIEFGAIGSSLILRATVHDAAGDILEDRAVRWSTGKTDVARVDSTGLLIAVGNGVDTITALAGALSARAPVRVAQVPAAIAIGAHARAMTFVGATALLEATLLDSLDNEIRGQAFAWSSSNPAVLAIEADGRVIAVSAGSSTVRASSGSVIDSTRITVRVTGPLGGPITGAPVSCNGGRAAIFDCGGIDLLSYLPLPAIGGRSGVSVSDLWGWTDPTTGAEYALVGRTDGTAFVDVSDPLNPVYLGELPTTAGSPHRFWRDIKVYADHAYIVADAAGAHGMQVFDLRQLRNASGVPKTFAATARYNNIASAHNIAVDEETGFAFAVGSNSGGTTCGGGLHMIDVRTPANPTFAGCFADPRTGFTSTGYTHDVQCVVYRGPDARYQGREVCFGSNESALSIADVTDKRAPVAISRASYPGVSYAHQGWISEDHRYFFSNDELDELNGRVAQTRLLIWDIADLDDPVLAAEHSGPTQATDHNLYIADDRLYQSNYHFGIRVLDISNPTQPVELGFFDTAPTVPNVPGFEGSWSNYPFFASGIIVVTSGREGLFVLERR